MAWAPFYPQAVDSQRFQAQSLLAQLIRSSRRRKGFGSLTALGFVLPAAPSFNLRTAPSFKRLAAPCFNWPGARGCIGLRAWASGASPNLFASSFDGMAGRLGSAAKASAGCGTSGRPAAISWLPSPGLLPSHPRRRH